MHAKTHQSSTSTNSLRLKLSASANSPSSSGTLGVNTHSACASLRSSSHHNSLGHWNCEAQNDIKIMDTVKRFKSNEAIWLCVMVYLWPLYRFLMSHKIWWESKIPDNMILTPVTGARLASGGFIGAAFEQSKSLHVFPFGVREYGNNLNPHHSFSLPSRCNLQSRVRTMITRHEFHYKLKSKAATVIQAHWRGYNAIAE
ncbi:hypothetical protein Bca4012_031371 [Brassica carinata]|uniref:BnaC04g55490D protein n=4 Tax=Brassica TaxID=3705 RepID=A0A078IM06_BRANA|nr:hypothetical protein HID58_060779 [Brassica napus]CAF1849160.1 unnamed protein product [Brassica napus]CDY52100.1 BnaC04g55490D [Brassica napus]VDD09588.1 unnamed protein product [Brassica oleracea]